MESDDVENPEVNVSNEERDSSTAVNSLILDYYKRFGRKRDLEQYFSLSSGQSEIRDPTSSFWRKMKAQNSSSDSGEKKSESSTELCRISIKCTVPEPSSSQNENQKTNSDSESPPIITDDVIAGPSRHSDDEASVKSDEYHSQKSADVTLDTSMNKLVSPSSSITSQRKLEWDSLADVGYANESDRKASSSSLSTLERLALKQQYSNNDTKDNIGTPTAHSTMLDENESKTKSIKGFVKRTTKLSNKDTDLVEVSLPKSEGKLTQSINLNLTKHISFHVEKHSGVNVGKVKQDVSHPPEKSSAKTENRDDKLDKEIQTSLIKPKQSAAIDKAESYDLRVPILINLNSLRKRCRKKKLRTKRRKLRVKKKSNVDKENVPVQEKSGEQVSEAESFEYMPGHMYHQNQMKHSQNRSTTAGNKSSLESSGAATTTDSSKNSKYSFTKDLEKSIELLKSALNKKYKNSNIKKELIKGVVQRLLETRYRDDDSSNEFLSRLSYSSKKLGLGQGTHTTTSTSDATTENFQPSKPKKSILRLRLDKFNSNVIASTSQSVPNLHTVSKSENPVYSKLDQPFFLINTESDASSKEKHTSDTAKTSSEELYQKYIVALKKEQAYKKHLKEKEHFLKQKLVGSGSAFNIPIQLETKSKNRLKDLIKDLTRNNYDDGSGDASKLEGGSSSYTNSNRFNLPKPRNHSVFTLSSCNCISGDSQHRKVCEETEKSNKHSVPQAGSSEEHNAIYGCPCFHSNFKIDVADSSVQCNLQHQNDKKPSHICIAHVVSGDESADEFVCVGAKKGLSVDVPENILIYKCSRLDNTEFQMDDSKQRSSHKICACFENKPASCSKHLLQPSTSKEGDKITNRRSDEIVESQNRRIKYNETKKKMIYDSVGLATRLIQTEISMNPRIPEPIISDINYIEDEDLVKFVSASYKEIPKKMSDGSLSKSHPDAQCNIHSVTSPFEQEIHIGNDVYPSDQQFYKKKQSDVDKVPLQTEIRDKDCQERFTIPIKGTNMTLLVSLGSKISTVPLDKTSNVPEEKNKSDPLDKDQKPLTVPIYGNKTSLSTMTGSKKSLKKAISSIAECSKEVQNQHSNLFDDFDRFSKCSKGVQSQNNDLFDELDRQSKDERHSVDAMHIEDADLMWQPTYKRDKDTQYKKNTQLQHKEVHENKNTKKDLRSGTEMPYQSREIVPQSRNEFGNDKPIDKYMSQQDFYIDDIKRNRDRRAHESGAKIAPHEDDNKSIEKKCRKEKQLALNQCNKYVQRDDRVEGPQYEDYYDDDSEQINYSEQPSSHQQDVKNQKEPHVHTFPYKDKNEVYDLMQQTQNIKTTVYENKQFIDGDNGEQNVGKCSNALVSKLQSKDSVDKEKHDFAQQSDEDHYDQPYNEKTKLKNNFEAQPRYTEDFDRRNENIDVNDEFKRPQLYSGFRCNAKPTIEQINVKTLLLPSSTDVSLQTDAPHNIDHEVYQKKSIGSDKTSKDTANFARQTEISLSDEANQNRGLTYKNETLKTFLRSGTDSESLNEYIKSVDNRVSSKQIQTSRQNTPDAQSNKPRINTEENSTKSYYLESNEVKLQYYDTQKPIEPSTTQTESHKLPQPTRFHDNRVTKSNKWGTQSDKHKYSCSEETSIAGASEKCKEKINISENRKNYGNTQKPTRTPNSLHQSKCQESCVSMSKCTTHKTCKCKCSCKDSSTSDSSNDCCNDMQGRSPNTFLTNTFHGVNCPCITTQNGTRQLQTSNTCWSGIPPQIVPGFSPCCSGNHAGSGYGSDPIMNLIHDITKRYAKEDVNKGNRKRCFKEIMLVLNYLLDTEDSSCHEDCTCCIQSSSEENVECSDESPQVPSKNECDQTNSKTADKGVQLPCEKSKTKRCNTECLASVAGESSEAPTCQILNNIKRECDKYYRKHCTANIKCSCRHVHQCQCRRHKCKSCKSKTNVETIKKKNHAYNLIVKPSETMNTKETSNKERRPLQNVVVKVPPKRKQTDKVPFKEMSCKIEKNNLNPNPRAPRSGRSRSWPHECETSSGDATRKCPTYTVRQYLEKNRPDFVQNCSQRQDCLKVTNEKRPEELCAPRLKMVVVHPPNYNGCTNPVNMYCPGTLTNHKPCVDAMTCNPCFDIHNVQYPCPVIKVATERSAQRQLLSAQLARQNELRSLSESQLRHLARELGITSKSKTQPPKFMSEREMKKHSQKIYKSLPEVKKKKEELKKENIKKTNLLMASLFKKNLQQKILRGSVNLSNYSTVIKI